MCYVSARLAQHAQQYVRTSLIRVPQYSVSVFRDSVLNTAYCSSGGFPFLPFLVGVIEVRTHRTMRVRRAYS
jgi:hypothetical protein